MAQVQKEYEDQKAFRVWMGTMVQMEQMVVQDQREREVIPELLALKEDLVFLQS